MVHPGAFQGSRKEFLIGEKPKYRDAVAGGFVKDAIADIQRRYFKRFPIDVPDSEEPSPEHLASVDDSEPDPEPPVPEKEELNAEEYKEQMEKLEARRKLVMLRKDQIKRWFLYQYAKETSDSADPHEPSNPYHRLLLNLAGTKPKAPRLNSAINTWRRSCREEIQAEAKLQAERLGKDGNMLASVREKVAKKMFEQLSREEQEEWASQAKEEHQEAMKEWKEQTARPPSTSLDDRQRAIDNLPNFVQPILDGICAVTGWKATLIAGGPEPAHQGRLNVISAHSGVTKGDIKMNFGRAEKIRYNTTILPIYGDFLKLCYSVDDCRACALPNGEEIEAATARDEVTDSDADPAASTTRDLPLPEDLLQPPLALSEHAAHVMAPASADDTSQAHMHIPSGRPTSPASVSSPPASLPKNLPTVATPRELSPHLEDFEKQNALPRTAGNDAANSLPATRSEGSLAHGALMPSMQPPPALVSLPLVNDQEPGQMQPKQGRSDEVAMGEEGMRAPPRRGSRRKRVSIQEPVEKESSDDKASTSASQPTRHKKGSTLQLPSPSATSWFSEFQKMFLEKGLGMEWEGFVSSWVAFEEKSRSTQVRRLSAVGRPAVVHNWIARRRPTNFQPKIPSLKDYETEFIDWWMRLQPTWRISNNTVDKAAIQGDWDCLRVPGVNGIMNVVVALFHWGLASEGKSAHHKAWLAAVEDCVTVFSLL